MFKHYTDNHKISKKVIDKKVKSHREFVDPLQ